MRYARFILQRNDTKGRTGTALPNAHRRASAARYPITDQRRLKQFLPFVSARLGWSASARKGSVDSDSAGLCQRYPKLNVSGRILRPEREFFEHVIIVVWPIWRRECRNCHSLESLFDSDGFLIRGDRVSVAARV